ncbi:MAG: TonB-dependent receptor plug domain-containing protein, partial [Candidatus Contendobacter sp.]|nr:TonB-dependent receptor plug domain-containing protein [Candidatus Contendobacter sp.]
MQIAKVILKHIVLTCLGITMGQTKAAAPDLTEFSIEDLMQIKVVSAAKVEQALQDTAAAVFVITADDIRRSGVTNVMEALRLAPGVEVAQIDSSRWAITIRGFNGRFANKLLVLIDGRSIYTSQFSGVYWEIQDLFLPDIERIEVIRGPGGSLWGANAVNGVINIITKNSKNTQGGLATLTAGNEERTIAGVRYGGKLGDHAHYRVYGQFTERDGLATPDGHDAGDDWRISKSGFRLDWTPLAKDAVAIQGDYYDGHFDQNLVT